MFRLTIKLVIAGLLAHAAYRVVPPFVNYFQFRDAAQEALIFHITPQFSGRRESPEQLLDKLAKLAAENDVPLGREDFQLALTARPVTLDARYTVQLEFFPRRYKPHLFLVHAEGEGSKYRRAER